MPGSRNKEVILSYSGPLKYDTIGQLINLLKEKVSVLGIKLVLYKKILLVMIESLENILKYNEHFEKDVLIRQKHLPSFTLERHEDKYIIASGNAVLNEDIPELKEKLKLINSLNSEGLKKLYKSTITNGQFTHKGGAGLGFIEIAKIATEKIVFSFNPINKHYSYYWLKVIIDDNSLNSPTETID